MPVHIAGSRSRPSPLVKNPPSHIEKVNRKAFDVNTESMYSKIGYDITFPKTSSLSRPVNKQDKPLSSLKSSSASLKGFKIDMKDIIHTENSTLGPGTSMFNIDQFDLISKFHH